MKPVIISLLLFILTAFCACNLDDLIKDVEPPQVGNILTTAESFMANPGDTVLFWVEATDPQDKALSYKWTLAAGEIIGSAQHDTLTWKAPLSGGDNQVAVKVSNSEKSVTRTETITVISSVKPYVKILYPSSTQYLVQYTPVTVKADAYHDNGIYQVQLWINDALLPGLPVQNAQEYKFVWDGAAPAGMVEIKVTAISQITSVSGSDSVRVPLEGIIRGKK